MRRPVGNGLGEDDAEEEEKEEEAVGFAPATHYHFTTICLVLRANDVLPSLVLLAVDVGSARRTSPLRWLSPCLCLCGPGGGVSVSLRSGRGPGLPLAVFLAHWTAEEMRCGRGSHLHNAFWLLWPPFPG